MHRVCWFFLLLPLTVFGQQNEQNLNFLGRTIQGIRTELDKHPEFNRWEEKSKFDDSGDSAIVAVSADKQISHFYQISPQGRCIVYIFAQSGGDITFYRQLFDKKFRKGDTPDTWFTISILGDGHQGDPAGGTGVIDTNGSLSKWRLSYEKSILILRCELVNR